jgi:MFS family permease
MPSYRGSGTVACGRDALQQRMVDVGEQRGSTPGYLSSLVGGLPRPFWFIWAGPVVNRCGRFGMPVMAFYLTQARHVPTARAGLVVALYGAGASIAAPLGGFVADHVGRRATMLTALMCGGTGIIALGFVQDLRTLAVLLFFIAVVAEMYRPGMQAAIADLVPIPDRPRAYGLVYWVINLGFAIGLAIGGVLSGISYRLLFVGDGGTTLVFAMLILFGVPETLPARPAPAPEAAAGASLWARLTVPYRDATFVAFLGLYFALWLVFGQNSTAFPIDMTAHGVSKASFGLILGMNGILIVLVQPVVGPLVARRDRSRMLAAGALLVGLGFGMYALARSAPLYALGVAVWTLGEIGFLPVASAVTADLAPRDVRGRYQGAYGLSFGLATCVAPALGTQVLQRFGSVALWSGCLALGVTIAAGHLLLGPALRRARVARMAAG